MQPCLFIGGKIGVGQAVGIHKGEFGQNAAVVGVLQGNACPVEIVPEVVVLADFGFGVGFVCDDGMGIERNNQGEEVFVGSDDI